MLLNDRVLRGQRIVDARLACAKRYCLAKGWDVTELTFEQVIEIRGTSDWLNAGDWPP